MSMHLEFEPHSWYGGFAIQNNEDSNEPCHFIYHAHSKECKTHNRITNPYDDVCEDYIPKWAGVTVDGMHYRIDTLRAETLRGLKKQIKDYRTKQ